MSTNLIIFYDIPSKLPGSAWSPNTWKIRYSLNFKGLAYRTVWVEFPDIQEQAQKLGASPTSIKPDGTPFYTLPMIHDPSTGSTVADSIRIALYLDATYPDSPRLIPEGTQGLQLAFVSAHSSTIAALGSLAPPMSIAVLNPVSKEFFKRTRERWFKKYEGVLPSEEEGGEKWQKLKDGFGTVDGWLDAGNLPGPFVMGNTVSFADFAIAAWVLWIKKLWGDDSKEWQSVQQWHGGRWAALLKRLEVYEVVP